jgi:hypothetical protein
MAVTVECRGVAPDVAPVVEAAIETVVGRIRQRDTQLMPPGDLLILLITTPTQRDSRSRGSRPRCFVVARR